jgi:hypothetical protein
MFINCCRVDFSHPAISNVVTCNICGLHFCDDCKHLSKCFICDEYTCNACLLISKHKQCIRCVVSNLALIKKLYSLNYKADLDFMKPLKKLLTDKIKVNKKRSHL